MEQVNLNEEELKKVRGTEEWMEFLLIVREMKHIVNECMLLPRICEANLLLKVIERKSGVKLPKVVYEQSNWKGMYLSVGIEKLDINKFSKIENFINKPRGGLWSSVYRPNEEYKSSWMEWICGNMESKLKPYGVVFELKEESEIFVIDSEEDYKYLVENYKINEKDKFVLNEIDFEAMVEDFDGVYLTPKGYASNIFKLGSWDVSSLVLFNLDCIKNEKRIDL